MPELPFIAIPRPITGASLNPQISNPVATGPGFSFPLIMQGTTVGKLKPSQIIGLVPLMDCTDTECRQLADPCCYVNVVFGVNGAVPTYENDFNTFLVNFPILAVNTNATVEMSLEEEVNGVWTTLVLLNNNTYGTYYPPGFSTDHKGYVGYAINWGKVYNLHGAGCYRFKITSQIISGGAGEQIVTQLTCQVSEPFRLSLFDCNRAHQTVKFEATMSGKIGDINNDGKVFDLCGINWYDSIRFKGFFGHEITPEYLEVLQEYQNGQMKRVRDEAIQKFKLKTHMLPKTLHDRFKVYALMADTTLVSDYNINNSDYNIRRKSVIKDGGYEPDYKDRLWRRAATVEVDFKEGIQGVIKSNCCEPPLRPIG